MKDRRSFITTASVLGFASLSGCMGSNSKRPELFETIELNKRSIHSNSTNWVISVEVDPSSEAYYIEHDLYRYESRRKNLPENQYKVEFPVVSRTDDSYSSYPPTGHKFTLIDGNKTIAETEVDFHEEITVSDPGFMNSAHGRQDTAGNWVSRAGGGHTGFTFSVANTGEFPIQIASAVVEGDIPSGPGPVSKYWPTAVWFRTDSGNYDFQSPRPYEQDIHPSLMLDPGEQTRVGAMGYNVSEYDSLCDGGNRNAQITIKTLNEYGVRANFDYHLSGQKDAGGCTEGQIEKFEISNHFG